MKRRLKNKLIKLVVLFESLLSVFIVAAILIEFVDLFKYIDIIFNLSPRNSYGYFQEFLSHILLLVIGLELIIMLIRHTPSSVVEVLTFGIARKLLVESDNMIDLVLGVIALAGLFAINKYLFRDDENAFVGGKINEEE